MPKYQVIVGNIGQVYSGPEESEAREVYCLYRERGIEGLGRCAHEDVTLCKDGEIVAEHTYAQGD